MSCCENNGSAEERCEERCRREWRECERACGEDDTRRQRHDHEIEGSVEIAEPQEDPHNHRFATVSGQAIPIGGGDHVHEVEFRTDFYEDHFHTFKGRSGGAIQVGGGRHVHFAMSQTNLVDGHRHQFRFASLINDPIGE